MVQNDSTGFDSKASWSRWRGVDFGICRAPRRPAPNMEIAVAFCHPSLDGDFEFSAARNFT